ncbi:MAG TPA: ABC transporter substrate-binding protein, partial [Acidimicrobiales bacterium]|nr:ABC transporter substrate-binding protein [Acidimicrobiales bacterium]
MTMTGLMRQAAAVSLGTLCLATLAAACGGGGGGGTTLMLYSGQHAQTTEALVQAFERESGIKAQVRFNDEDTFANEIVEEASHPKTDLFFTENSPPLEFLQEKGLLAPVDPSTLRRTPARFDSPDGDWVGVSARVSVIIYNPRLIPAAQLPTKILQLASPKYRGKLALAPGESDFLPIVTAVDHA